MPYKEPQHPSELTPWDRKILREIFYGSTQIAAARKHGVPPLRVHTLVRSPAGRAFLADMENDLQAKASHAAEEITGGNSDDPMFDAATKESVSVLLTVLRTGRSLRDRLASAERIVRLGSELRRQAAARGGPVVQVTQQEVDKATAGALACSLDVRQEWLNVRDSFLAWLRSQPEHFEKMVFVQWRRNLEEHAAWRAENPNEVPDSGEFTWWQH